VLDLSKGEADIAIRGGGADDGALVGKKIAEVPWAIFASAALVSRYGRPTSSDLNNFGVVEFSGDIEGLPAARWMKSHAPNAPIVASCSNIPLRTFSYQVLSRSRAFARRICGGGP
jgi:DNA-binding transcriptional LysR family regulator